MDRKKQTQPQARRDSDGTLRGSVHGSEGDTEGASSATGATKVVPTNTASELPSKAGRVDTEETVLARARFVPRECPNCIADRPAGSNYSYVQHTAGRVRYCHCKFCGHTWTQAKSQ